MIESSVFYKQSHKITLNTGVPTNLYSLSHDLCSDLRGIIRDIETELSQNMGSGQSLTSNNATFYGSDPDDERQPTSSNPLLAIFSFTLSSENFDSSTVAKLMETKLKTAIQEFLQKNNRLISTHIDKCLNRDDLYRGYETASGIHITAAFSMENVREL